MVQTTGKIQMPDEIAKLLIVANTQLGGVKLSNNMKGYIFGQRKDGINIFDLEQTWEKMILAARACVAFKNSELITVISSKTFGRKPVLKFAEAIGARPNTGRFMPGLFTNTNIKGSCEPRLIIVSDPVADKQAVMEASKVNCPTIAFCNTDADLSFVDIAIPVNNRSPNAIGASFFVLSRLVNFIRTGAPMDENITEVELFFYRDASELEALMAEQASEEEAFYADEYANNNDVDADFGQPQSNAQIEESCGWGE